MIISASRRTDIPCYYSEWFVNRLKAGYVLSKNPMNPNQIKRISLSPDEVDCIVFWTKDPINMLDKLSLIDKLGYRYYFQFTLNPYGIDIERNLRNKEDIVNTFIQLSKRIGSEKLLWRYDPVIINENHRVDYHLHNFAYLCSKLQGYTKKCTISFVDDYKKLDKAVRDYIIRDIDEDTQHYIAKSFVEIAAGYGIEIRACCEKADLINYGVKPAACIDKELIETICGYSLNIKKDKNQRPACNCAESTDIGVYNSCRNGCIYCYANHSEASINRNCMRYNPVSDILL